MIWLVSQAPKDSIKAKDMAQAIPEAKDMAQAILEAKAWLELRVSLHLDRLAIYICLVLANINFICQGHLLLFPDVTLRAKDNIFQDLVVLGSAWGWCKTLTHMLPARSQKGKFVR